MKTTAGGSISTGDHLIIEINRGLSAVKKEPPKQLKTVPLTAKGLAAAQASAAALSKANSRDSKVPALAAKSDTGSAVAITRAAISTRKKRSRGARLTLVAIVD